MVSTRRAIYGYLTDNIFPLFVQCVIGVIANAVFIVIYYRHSSHSERQRVVRLSSIAATCLAIVTAYVVLGTNGTLGDAFRNVTTPMGYISVAINIFMYGSPLEVMMDVIRAKSAAALPIAFIVMSFINCALWVALGLAVHDVFVLTPNVISTAVSAVQIVLYLIYPPQKGTDDEERSLVWDHPGAGVATFPVYEANALPTHHVHPKTSSE